MYFSDNLGRTWQDIGSSLPDVPANDIVVDPQLGMVYLATDIGVFYQKEGDSSWQPLGQGLPTCPITDLDILVDERVLAAATYGRSMYTYQLPLATSTKAIRDPQMAIKIYPQPASDWVNIQSDHSIKMQFIRLFDVNGSLLFQQTLAGSHQSEIPVANYPAGTYLMQIQLKDGAQFSRMLQITKN